MEVGGARPNLGGARRLRDPRPGAARPGVYAFAPTTPVSFLRNAGLQDSPLLPA